MFYREVLRKILILNGTYGTYGTYGTKLTRTSRNRQRGILCGYCSFAQYILD